MQHARPPQFEPERRIDVRADSRLMEGGQIDAVEFLIRSLARLLPILESELRAMPREAFEAVAETMRDSMRRHRGQP